MVKIHLRDPSFFIRLCLESEYAFTIVYHDLTQVRVAHGKGNWSLAKVPKKGEIDYIDHYSDCFSGFSSKSPLVAGMLKGLESEVPKNLDDWRRGPAWVLERFIKLWAYGADIVEIIVHQQGRNAYVDELGVFTFSPREDEWIKK